MEAIRSSETSVHTRSTQRHIPEGRQSTFRGLFTAIIHRHAAIRQKYQSKAFFSVVMGFVKNLYGGPERDLIHSAPSELVVSHNRDVKNVLYTLLHPTAWQVSFLLVEGMSCGNYPLTVHYIVFFNLRS
jgi:hypothetical protein